jgi:hypothetical protein
MAQDQMPPTNGPKGPRQKRRRHTKPGKPSSPLPYVATRPGANDELPSSELGEFGKRPAVTRDAEGNIIFTGGANLSPAAVAAINAPPGKAVPTFLEGWVTPPPSASDESGSEERQGSQLRPQRTQAGQWYDKIAQSLLDDPLPTAGLAATELSMVSGVTESGASVAPSRPDNDSVATTPHKNLSTHIDKENAALNVVMF